jgi:hypothetical protein
MHLSSEEALDLIEARATADRVLIWKTHLESCSRCRRKMADWGETYALLKRQNLENAPESVLKMAAAIFEPAVSSEPSGIGKILASVVFDSFAQPALAGARGAASARQLLLTADVFDIHVRVWDDGPDRRMTGQIFSRGTDDAVPNIPVHLVEHGKRIGTTTADDFGEFEFNKLPHGPLQLQIDLPRLTVEGELNLD